jgi:NNP family nitrate/nitrite transporter-like MFS transporter
MQVTSPSMNQMKIRTDSPNYRWYILALTMGASALMPGAARMCMPVLFKEISVNLHLNLVSIGTVWGLDPLAGVFIGLPSGLLADRFGIKRTITVSCFLAAIFGALRGLSVNFSTLAASMFFYGFLGASSPNLVAKATALWFKGERLALANAFTNMAWAMGSMSATMLSATVISPWLGSWRGVTFFWAVPCAALGLLWLFTGREPVRHETPEESAVSVPFRQAISHVARVRDVWMMGLLTLAHFGATMGLLGYLVLYLRNIGWTDAAADSTLTVLNGVGMLGMIPLVLISDKIISRKAVLGLAILSLTAILALLPFVNRTGIWLLIIIGGLLRSGGPAMINVIIFEAQGVGSLYGGTAIGLSNAIGMMGSFLAPPLGNSLATYSSGLPLLFWAALSILALVPLFFIKSGAGRAYKTI